MDALRSTFWEGKALLIIEIILLCALFFLLCYLGTGTDEKNLRNYSSYPDVVQARVREINAYRGKWKETGKLTVWMANFALFVVLFLPFGFFIREHDWLHNVISLFLLGQSLNVFDLVVIDLLWWRNTERIRFSKIPEKALYQDPKKHIAAFLRAIVLYLFVALVDGYLLTLV